MNAYEVLNIPVTATKEEIRAAYRDMARRWHPDRFLAGPERDWANEKMADINAAYRFCMKGLRSASVAAECEDEALRSVQKLIDDGHYLSAREMLMRFNTRCAEWNYLFGAVLLRLSETEKALIYLSVATHQDPASVKYARARKEAQRMNGVGKLSGLFARMRRA